MTIGDLLRFDCKLAPPPRERAPAPEMRHEGNDGQSFAAMLEEASAEAPIAPSVSPDHAEAFSHASLFGRRFDALARLEAAIEPQPSDPKRSARTPSPVEAPQDVEPAKSQRAEWVARLHSTSAPPNAHKLNAPRGARLVRHDRAPSQAPTTSDALDATTEKFEAPATKRSPTRLHDSAVTVALHAIDGELAVYARPGRMAPTERARLRNAIAHVLAEHGHYDALVTLADTRGSAWLK